jgi:hypothetical protein
MKYLKKKFIKSVKTIINLFYLLAKVHLKIFFKS